MAQPHLDRTTREDTATLFRADADSLRLSGIIPVSATLAGQKADNDETYDETVYERSTAPGQPRRRKLTADEDALAKKSGYQITDERDINGAQNATNGTTGTTATTKAQTDMLRQAAASQSVFSRVTSTVSNLWNNYVADPVSRLWNGATSMFDNYIAQPFANAWNNMQQTFDNYISQPLANAWQNTKNAFSEYVAQPVSNLVNRASEIASSTWEGTKNTFNEYVAQPVSNLTSSARSSFNEHVAQPVSNLANRVGEAASSALETVQNTASEYIGQPAARLANSVSEMASSAWQGTKNFLGFGSEATAEQSTPQVAARRESAPERPTAAAQTLSGEQNNPSAGFSLTSAFGNALDRASQALGLDNDGPSVRAATSAPVVGLVR